MPNLNTVEIKAFVPAKDFELSKRFYEDLGFAKASDGEGVAYFLHGECSFLLQDFYEEGLAKNLMMHLLVEDVDAWWAHLHAKDLPGAYGASVKVTEVETRPWRMRDFVLIDPSGVMWRIGQNISLAEEA